MECPRPPELDGSTSGLHGIQVGHCCELHAASSLNRARRSDRVVSLCPYEASTSRCFIYRQDVGKDIRGLVSPPFLTPIKRADRSWSSGSELEKSKISVLLHTTCRCRRLGKSTSRAECATSTCPGVLPVIGGGQHNPDCRIAETLPFRERRPRLCDDPKLGIRGPNTPRCTRTDALRSG
mgnify:CR=1 FL=1